MKHASSLPAGETPDPILTPERLLASIGINCYVGVEPPAWITARLSAEQRAAIAAGVAGAAERGIAAPENLAISLFKLALVPGLPEAAAPYLFFVASELFAARVLDDERQLAADAGVVSTAFSRRHEIEKLIAQAEAELLGEFAPEGEADAESQR